MTPEAIKKALCDAFCHTATVSAVPVGYAISSVFQDGSGDPLTFYLVQEEEGYRLEDDGSYLSHLIAKDIPIDQGQRGQVLDAILAQSDAYWDKETFEIRSNIINKELISSKIVDFLSALIRVRDLELLTREMVRSTFREDATRAILSKFSDVANIEEDAPVSKALSEFPADVVIRPGTEDHIRRTGAVYFVNTNDKLNEALLHQLELQTQGINDVAVIALLETAEMRQISPRRFQRAQNRSLPMPIFRGDEDRAMTFIMEQLRLKAAS